MDATNDLREEEKVRLLNRLAEIMVEEQRELGRFRSTPHLCELETISQSLAQRLGCVPNGHLRVGVLDDHLARLADDCTGIRRRGVFGVLLRLGAVVRKIRRTTPG